jgi:hypothetical protein
MYQTPSRDPYYDDPQDPGEIRPVRQTYDIWHDWFVVFVIWAGCIAFGGAVGWTLGA